jgi:glycerol-3-phosphate O-acyltransferase 3/4
MIAKKAGLINVPWDGYLKYFRPSPRFTEHKQRVFAAGLIKVRKLQLCDLALDLTFVKIN